MGRPQRPPNRGNGHAAEERPLGVQLVGSERGHAKHEGARHVVFPEELFPQCPGAGVWRLGIVETTRRTKPLASLWGLNRLGGGRWRKSFGDAGRLPRA